MAKVARKKAPQRQTSKTAKTKAAPQAAPEALAASKTGIGATTVLVSIGVIIAGFLAINYYQSRQPAVQNTKIAAPTPGSLSSTKTAVVPPKAMSATSRSKNTTPNSAAPKTAMPQTPATKPTTKSTPADTRPSFDIVRVEPDGTAVIAGRAAPGSEVVVMSNNKPIGKVKSNARGEWALVLSKPLKSGAHDLAIVSQKPGSKVKMRSQQNVAVAIPKQRDTKPLVVLSRKDKPSRVLQQPAAPTPGQVAANKTAPMSPGKLALQTVDYDNTGKILFNGNGTPGRIARIYVDNKFLHDVIISPAGVWTLSTLSNIVPGNHRLRVDELDKVGKVHARIELPFTRAQPEAVIALNKARATAAAQAKSVNPGSVKPAKPTTATVKPAMTKTAVAKPAMPQPATTKPAMAAPDKPAPAAPQMAAVKPSAPTSAPTRAPATSQTATSQTAVAKPSTLMAKPAPATPTAPKVAVAKPVPQETMPAKPAPAGVNNTPKTNVMRGAAPKATPQPTPNPASVATPGGIVIQPGNNLWNIARVIYGEGVRYTTIYQANTDQIRDPDLIYPGQIFKTPGVSAPKSISPDQRAPLQ